MDKIHLQRYKHNTLWGNVEPAFKRLFRRSIRIETYDSVISPCETNVISRFHGKPRLAWISI